MKQWEEGGLAGVGKSCSENWEEMKGKEELTCVQGRKEV
jgi:hypothetical protein